MPQQDYFNKGTVLRRITRPNFNVIITDGYFARPGVISISRVINSLRKQNSIQL